MRESHACAYGRLQDTLPHHPVYPGDVHVFSLAGPAADAPRPSVAAVPPPAPVGIASDWLLREEELAYDLSDPVGSGGFAQVFRGKYRGQDVAVKVIHQNLLDNEER